MPNISVVIPAYNSSGTIEECLRAVRNSIYRDYELIVADCNSRDGTGLIADKYADKAIILQDKANRALARENGVKAAKGDIIVNVDSDIVIKPDTLNKIALYFSGHPDVSAVTGLLAKEHPNQDFFSQYKNLYMHYIFKRLPSSVNFLYGSIYAIRKDAAVFYGHDIKLAEDTAFGQELVNTGKKIAFLDGLEVVHLKRYSFSSFIKNDFLIPFYWVKVFCSYKGWRQLWRDKTGFAHSPKEQLVSVALAPLILLLTTAGLFIHSLTPLIILLCLGWAVLNFRFLNYLRKERGPVFGIASLFVTFIDNIIMAAGIFSGFLYALIKLNPRAYR